MHLTSARYRVLNHPAFGDPLSKEDLYLLLERGSIARGDICEDMITGQSHTVGQLTTGMRPPRPQDPAVSIDRPLYQEIRVDWPEDEPGEAEEGQDPEADGEDPDADEFDEDLEEDEEELEEDDESEEGERLLYHGHPTWLAFSKALLLCILLVIAAGLAFQFGMRYFVLGMLTSSAVFTMVAIARYARSYLVTDERVEIVWGIFGRSSKEVRIRDIRAIDVHERGLKGMLGIGTVDFSSSGNAGVEVQFKNVRKAHRIKELVRALQAECSSE